MSKFPLRIHAAPEGEFGQGFETVKLSVWNERSTYRDEQQYVRADVADDMLAALKTLCIPDVSYHDGEIRIPLSDHGAALNAMRVAREAIAKAEGRS